MLEVPQNKIVTGQLQCLAGHRYNSLANLVPESNEGKSPESPTHRYTLRAEQISKDIVKFRKKSLKRKIICINPPRTDLNVIGTPRLPSKLRTSSNANIIPNSDNKKENSELRSASSAKDPDPSMYLTIRLPQLKFQVKTDPKSSRNSKALVINPITDRTTANFCPQSKPGKEIISVSYNLQEIYKIMKYRSDDIIILDGLVNNNDGNLKVPVNLVDDVIIKVEYRENVRIAMESNKINSIKDMVVDDRETRKNIIKKTKKAISNFERKYTQNINATQNLSESSMNEIRNMSLSIGEQVKNIMSGQCLLGGNNTNCEQKPPISMDHTLAKTLRLLFQEPKIDPYFIGNLCILYSRIQLLKSQKRTIEAYNKAAQNSTQIKRIWTRQISTSALWVNSAEMQNQYNRMCKSKILEIMMNRNAGILADIREYSSGYKKRRGSGGDN